MPSLWSGCWKVVVATEILIPAHRVNRSSATPTTCSPLTVGHLHGLQLGVRPSVEAFHLLLLQSFQQTDGVLVDATSLRQHQRGWSIVVTMMRDNQQSAVRPNTYLNKINTKTLKETAYLQHTKPKIINICQQAVTVRVKLKGSQIHRKVKIHSSLWFHVKTDFSAAYKQEPKSRSLQELQPTITLELNNLPVVFKFIGLSENARNHFHQFFNCCVLSNQHSKIPTCATYNNPFI